MAWRPGSLPSFTPRSISFIHLFTHPFIPCMVFKGAAVCQARCQARGMNKKPLPAPEGLTVKRWREQPGECSPDTWPGGGGGAGRRGALGRARSSPLFLCRPTSCSHKYEAS